MRNRTTVKSAAQSVRFEGLEQRRLFATGGISGSLFHDLDGDGYRDYDELNSSVHAAYLDLNNSGTRESNEPIAYSTSNGYRFDGLENGTYVVRLLESDLGAGEFVTTPGGSRTTTVQNAGHYAGVDIGYATNGSIAGHTYEETSESYWSFNSGDPIVTGRTVYVDLNNNGTLDTDEPSAITPASGRGYRFDGLKPGAYAVREVMPDGWHSTNPVSSVIVRSGQIAAANLGSRTIPAGAGVLTVEQFVDLNANQSRDTFESGLNTYAYHLYLDLNENGVKDGSDIGPTVYASNYAVFVGIQPGTYQLAIRSSGSYLPSGGASQQVVIAAGESVSVVYGMTSKTVTLEGTIFNDLDRDGVKDANETTGLNESARIYVDLNDNGVYDSTEPNTYASNGSFSIYSVPIGTYAVRIAMSPAYRLSHQSANVAEGSTYNETGVLAIPNDLLFTAGSTYTTTSLTFGAYRTSAISGWVYNDLNRNGSQNSGETGIEGRTVYIDADNDGIFDEGETSTLTDAAGLYIFTGLDAGTYTIRAVLPAGWAQSYPSGNAAIVSIIGQGDQLTSKNYLQYLIPTTGAISATAYTDRAANGVRDGSDTVLSGVTFYLDTNVDGSLDENEPTQVSDSSGTVLFTGLVPGDYVVRAIAPANYVLTSPDLAAATVVVGATTAAGSVGVFENQTININVYDDLNADRRQQWNEKGMANFQLFFDSNLNNQLDEGERVVTTGPDGKLVLTQGPEYFFLVALPPQGYRMVNLTGRGDVPRSGVKYNITYGATAKASVSGIVYVDRNANEALDGNDAWLGGQIVYADLNGNAKRDAGEPFTVSDQSFSLGGLEAGTYTLRLDALPDTTVVAPTSVVVTVQAGKEYNGSSIRFRVNSPGTSSLVNYTPMSAVEGGSVAVTGVSFTNASGWDWDIDYDPALGFQYDTQTAGRIFDVGSRDSGTFLIVARPYQFVNGSTVFGSMAYIPIDIINVAPTAVLTGVDAPAFGGAGVKFDSIVEPSAADMAALKFSYDFDNDGTFDVVDSSSSSMQLPSSLANTPGTYTVRARIADKDGGFNDYTTTVVVSPAQFGSISGVTYNDNNANGVFDAGDSRISRTVFLDKDNDGQLDAGEVSMTSASDGSFTFANLTPGSYQVRRVFPSGYKASNTPRDYDLVGGQTITGADIGSVTSRTVVTPPGENPPPSDPKTASITGRTYNDNNANGVFDAGDQLITGKTVFIDANNNGRLDLGETSTKSNSSGVFTFGGLAAGAYNVRRVFPSGYTYSNAPINLTLTAAQVATGADIGSVPVGTVVNAQPVAPAPTTPATPPSNDTGSISGFLFWDADRDGTFDSGESFQGGKTVFIDLDDDNILDSNERSLTTDSQGRFTFDGLLAGTYNIKRVMPKGYAATTAAQVITLGAGELFSGVAIGTNTN